MSEKACMRLWTILTITLLHQVTVIRLTESKRRTICRHKQWMYSTKWGALILASRLFLFTCISWQITSWKRIGSGAMSDSKVGQLARLYCINIKVSPYICMDLTKSEWKITSYMSDLLPIYLGNLSWTTNEPHLIDKLLRYIASYFVW